MRCGKHLLRAGATFPRTALTFRKSPLTGRKTLRMLMLLRLTPCFKRYGVTTLFPTSSMSHLRQRSRQICPHLPTLRRKPSERAEAERLAAEGVFELRGGDLSLCAEVPAAGLRAPEHLAEGPNLRRHAGGAGHGPVVVPALPAASHGGPRPAADGNDRGPRLEGHPLPAEVVLRPLNGAEDFDGVWRAYGSHRANGSETGGLAYHGATFTLRSLVDRRLTVGDTARHEHSPRNRKRGNVAATYSAADAARLVAIARRGQASGGATTPESS